MKAENNSGARVNMFRLQQGLTLSALAARSGLTKGYLSKITRSAEPPPFSTLQRIASALNVDVTEILPAGAPDGGERNIDFLPAPARKRLPYKTDPVCAFMPLLARYRNKQMSPFLMRIHPGKSRVFKHDAEEFVYVLDGEIELDYDGRRHRFNTGDCFYLDSRIGHVFINLGKKPVDLLSVDFDYRRF